MSSKWLKKAVVTSLAILSVGGWAGAPATLSQSQVKLSQVQAQESREIRWSQGSEITTLDSAKAYDQVAFTALKQVSEGLYRIQADGTLAPAGAKDYTLSEDGLTYTFQLREDAKWSNGDPVTAQDYVYAWQRAINPETGSANAERFSLLENGKEIQAGEAEVSSLGVEAKGEYELVVRLAEPRANFLYYLTTANYYPQHQASVEAAGDAYGSSSEHFLGNGPFIIEDWSATSLTWVNRKNPNYYGADAIEVEAVHYDVVKDVNTAVELWEAGQIDATLISGPLLAEFQGHEQLISFPGRSHSYIEFGISSSQPLQNEHVRKAFSLVIDRDTLTQQILSGGAEKVKGLVPQKAAFNTETGEDYVDQQPDYALFNIEEAKQHWEKAKEELGLDSIELALLVTDNETSKTVGEYIQGQVENNLEGFKIALTPLPAKNRFEQMMSFQFDIALGGWSGSLGDPDEFLVNFLTGAEHNHAQFFDEEYDRLVEVANSPEAIADPVKRFELLHEAENYLLDRQILVPLIQTNQNYLVGEKIKDLQVLPDGSGVDFTSLTFK